MLPVCSHAFHVDCIDIWVRSHANCSLCHATPGFLSDLRNSARSWRRQFGPASSTGAPMRYLVFQIENFWSLISPSPVGSRIATPTKLAAETISTMTVKNNN
ncbi:unnamed protein product [Linum tenue]|uniref:RING-type E3 ubiquitin transferase n=2 Tax=Linum tenue TaxID=586396 RepID=A0AAV0MMK1_9ROSI|nr:unnamed protein product [Linum tenue]